MKPSGPGKKNIFNFLVERDGLICGICDLEIERHDATIDHIIPLSEDGTWHPQNLRLAHGKCNHDKGSRLPPKAEMKRILNAIDGMTVAEAWTELNVRFKEKWNYRHLTLCTKCGNNLRCLIGTQHPAETCTPRFHKCNRRMISVEEICISFRYIIDYVNNLMSGEFQP